MLSFEFKGQLEASAMQCDTLQGGGGMWMLSSQRQGGVGPSEAKLKIFLWLPLAKICDVTRIPLDSMPYSMASMASMASMESMDSRCNGV